MRIESRPATVSDVYEIARNLSEINKCELRAKFGENWWPALGMARKFLLAGPADTFTFNGEPIAILGHMPHATMESRRVTWFLATEDVFGKKSVQCVVAGRNYIRGLRRNYPGVTFISYSESKHPGVDRWFRLLGYESNSEGVSGCRVYTVTPAAVA